MFEEYLKEISSGFTMDTYDLIKKNCNHFTDTALEFLTGTPLPDYIKG